MKELSAEDGVMTAESDGDLCRRADVLFLAVKPRQVRGVLKELSPLIGEDKLLISLAAGITLPQIESILKEKARLIRVMPNTPLLVAKGMSAVTCGRAVGEEDRDLALKIFGSLGRVVEVEEGLMNAVTALSGSGPAYVFGFIEGLADGGVKVGLGRQEALMLAAQTVAGAAEMVLATGRHPGELKDMVTSPGGTTIRGYHVLEEAGLKGLLISAVEAAYLRARQLAED
jgi:pyrroline-5-carboxylate reductase